jgi:hypothetical protein
MIKLLKTNGKEKNLKSNQTRMKSCVCVGGRGGKQERRQGSNTFRVLEEQPANIFFKNKGELALLAHACNPT